MISRDQIRAARALLDWSQPQLAERAGVSTDLISKIENGVTDGSLKTITRIQSVFESAGIEFLENDGIKRQVNLVKTYTGQEGFINFMWGVYEKVKTEGGLICVSNVDESLFSKWMGDDEEKKYDAFMSNLDDIEMHILVQEGDDNFSASGYAKYKWIEKKSFHNVPFYVYSNRLALILFGEDNIRVVEIQNEDVAQAYKINFEYLWNRAKVPC